MPKIEKTSDRTFVLDYSDMISPMEQVRRQVSEVIARDTDGKVRQALIELGWTPPDDKAN